MLIQIENFVVIKRAFIVSIFKTMLALKLIVNFSKQHKLVISQSFFQFVKREEGDH